MDLQTTKITIRSLVASGMKKAYTTRQLLIDFRDFTGQCMPLLGFSTHRELLESLTDTIKLHGQWPNQTIQLVSSTKTVHLEQLILGQKKSTSKCARKSFTHHSQRPLPPRRPLLSPLPCVPPTSSHNGYSSGHCSNARFTAPPSLLSYQVPPPSSLTDPIPSDRERRAYTLSTPRAEPVACGSGYNDDNSFELTIGRSSTPYTQSHPSARNTQSFQGPDELPKPSRDLAREESTHTIHHLQSNPPCQQPSPRPDYNSMGAVPKSVSPIVEHSKPSPQYGSGRGAKICPPKPLPVITPTKPLPIVNNDSESSKKPIRTESGHLASGQSGKGCVSDIDPDDLCRINSESPIPQKVQRRFIEIGRKHPEGVWLTKLPAIYEQLYKSPLPPASEYGMYDLPSVISSLDKIFRIVRPVDKGNYKLFFEGFPVSDEEQRLKNSGQLFPQPTTAMKSKIRRVLFSYRTNEVIGVFRDEFENLYQNMIGERLHYDSCGFKSLNDLLDSLEGTVLETRKIDGRTFLMYLKPPVEGPAIPNFDRTDPIFRKYFTPEFVGPHEDLPPFEYGDEVTVGAEVDVVTGEVFTPSKFYLQLRREARDLDDLMDEMSDFYQENYDDYEFPKCAALKGVVCAAKYKDIGWHRVVIDSVNPSGSVNGYYVDYGSVWCLKRTSLRKLHRKFSHLRVQAFRATLGLVRPFGRSWSDEANVKFLQKASSRDVRAYIMCFENEGKTKIAHVSLNFTEKNEDIPMDKFLIEEGFAIVRRGGDEPDNEPTERETTPTSIKKERSVFDEDIYISYDEPPLFEDIAPLRLDSPPPSDNAEETATISSLSPIPPVAEDIKDEYADDYLTLDMSSSDTADFSTESPKEQIVTPGAATPPLGPPPGFSELPSTSYIPSFSASHTQPTQTLNWNDPIHSLVAAFSELLSRKEAAQSWPAVPPGFSQYQCAPQYYQQPVPYTQTPYYPTYYQQPMTAYGPYPPMMAPTPNHTRYQNPTYYHSNSVYGSSSANLAPAPQVSPHSQPSATSIPGFPEQSLPASFPNHPPYERSSPVGRSFTPSPPLGGKSASDSQQVKKPADTSPVPTATVTKISIEGASFRLAEYRRVSYIFVDDVLECRLLIPEGSALPEFSKCYEPSSREAPELHIAVKKSQEEGTIVDDKLRLITMNQFFDVVNSLEDADKQFVMKLTRVLKGPCEKDIFSTD